MGAWVKSLSDRPLAERCLFWPTAGPPMLPGAYNNNYQFVQAPGYLVILVEMIHDVRVIPIDGFYEFAVDDPTAFTRPWTARIPMTRTPGPLFEYACHEP